VKSSTVVMGGGTHIYDKTKEKRRFAVLAAWSIVMGIAKILGNRIYLIGIGVEPVETKWGVFFAKSIFRLADFMSLRDTASFEIVQSLGFEYKAVLSFDLSALLLDSFASSPTKDDQSEGGAFRDPYPQKIGVSLLPFFQIYYGDDSVDNRIVHVIAEALNKWLAKDDKNAVFLFAINGAPKEGDTDITNLLRASLTPQKRVRLIPYDADPRHAFSQIAQCDAFVGMRYHSCIFAYLSRVPLLMINYFNKCEALAHDIKLSQNALITPEEIVNGKLEEKITQLTSSPALFKAGLPPEEAKKLAGKNVIGWVW
jgi:polysaccharide pyruvyl transferase WcaK-like protein